MKKVLSLFLCLAMTLSFSAPVSARMLNPRDETASSSQSSPEKKKSTAKKDTTVKKDDAAVKETTKRDTTVTADAALTPIQYIARIEAIRMTFTGDFASFVDIMFSPTTSEATLVKEMGKLTDSMAKAIADMGKLKAPKEFAKASRLFRVAASEASNWNKLVKKALKSDIKSDMDKADAATESLAKALDAAFAEYDRVYDNLM